MIRILNFKTCAALSLLLLWNCAQPFCLASETTNSNVEKNFGIINKLVYREIKWSLIPSDPNAEKSVYLPGQKITAPKFSLYTALYGVETYCGCIVVDSPMVLKLKLLSRGNFTVDVWIDGSRTKSFKIDSSSSSSPNRETVMEKEIEILITSLIVYQQYYKLRLDITANPISMNRKDNAGDHNFFSISEAASFFPAAAEFREKMDLWIYSIYMARAVLDAVQIGKITGAGANINKLTDAYNKAVLMMNTIFLKFGYTLDELNAVIKDSFNCLSPFKKPMKKFGVYLLASTFPNKSRSIFLPGSMDERSSAAELSISAADDFLQKVPDSRLAFGEAYIYDYIENREPGLFDVIKKHILSGRWEIAGCMWANPDLSLVSGESLVRHILFGKRYFKEKFGLDIALIHVSTLPKFEDSSVFSPALPQVFFKSGVDYFLLCSTIDSPDFHKPTYFFSWRQGPGSSGPKVLTYFPFSLDLSPGNDNIYKDIFAVMQDTISNPAKKSLLLFQHQDQPGKYSSYISRFISAYKQFPVAPHLGFSRSADFMAQLEPGLKKNNNIPDFTSNFTSEAGTEGLFPTSTPSSPIPLYIYNSDLLQADSDLESSLSTAEKLSSLALLLGRPYPSDVLNPAWKSLLKNQSSEFTGPRLNPGPGSSSYTAASTDPDIRKNRDMVSQIAYDAVQFITGLIDTRPVAGIPVVVFNPLAHTRPGFVTVPIPLEPGKDKHVRVTVTHPSGRSVPSWIIAKEKEDKAGKENEADVRFWASDIPSLGYTVFSINVEYTGAEPGVPVDTAVQNPTPAGSDTNATTTLRMENPFFIIDINRNNGFITGICDKRLNMDFIPRGKEAHVLDCAELLDARLENNTLTPGGSMLWELKSPPTVKVDVKVEMIENSPFRQIVRVKKSFSPPDTAAISQSKSPGDTALYLFQDITIFNHQDHIDIHTFIEAVNPGHFFFPILLEAFFPVDFSLSAGKMEVAAGVPFGSICRTVAGDPSITPNSNLIPLHALRWADFSFSSLSSSQTHGFSIFSPTPFSCRFLPGGISLSFASILPVTGSTSESAPRRFAFRYSIMTHAGNAMPTNVPNRAAEFESPLVPVVSSQHDGQLPLESSFFTIQEEGSVVLDTVKKAEDDNSIILRFYELGGNASQTGILFLKTPKKVYETDLLERNPKEFFPTAMTGNSLHLDFKPFEIKTLKVVF